MLVKSSCCSSSNRSSCSSSDCFFPHQDVRVFVHHILEKAFEKDRDRDDKDHCSKRHDCKQNTLTTGPFTVPVFEEDGTGIPNNRLVVTIKNPTNTPLTASLTLDACLAPTTPTGGITFGTPLTMPEQTVQTLPTTTIPARSCTTINYDITAYQRGTLRLTTTGDYLVGEDKPICGKLEISVTGGYGAATGGLPDSGLNFGDATMFFRYEDFVVCKDC